MIPKASTFAIPPIANLRPGDGQRPAEIRADELRERQVSTSVYVDAMERRLLAFRDGKEVAADSDCRHLSHVMACCAILLDAAACGQLNDDRPKPGTAGAAIASYPGRNRL